MADKSKALETVISQLEKSYGKGTIMKLGVNSTLNVESISTGIDESNIKTMPIDALPLSERTRNALIKNQILYVEDLERKKKAELLLMKWVWKKAIDEINDSFKQLGKQPIA